MNYNINMTLHSWRLLHTGAADGATNMAVDEAILSAHAQGLAPPTLRFYGWVPSCLSVGVFQSVEREIDIAECQRRGIDVVRRATGGRAVFHAAEVTYSLVTSAGRAFATGNVRESYYSISVALAAGLRTLGVKAQVAPQRAGYRISDDGDGIPWGKTPSCFDLPSDHEITVLGRKLVGSAQLRRGEAILQHGSILLDVDPAANLAILRVRNDLPRDLLAQRLASRMIGLREALGREVVFSEVAQAIAQGFQRSAQLDLLPGNLSDEEIKLANTFRHEKYARDAWNYRR